MLDIFKRLIPEKKKCDFCGREFEIGNRQDGLPNGVGLVKDGKETTVCTECLIRMGTEMEKDG